MLGKARHGQRIIDLHPGAQLDQFDNDVDGGSVPQVGRTWFECKSHYPDDVSPDDFQYLLQFFNHDVALAIVNLQRGFQQIHGYP